MLQTVIVSSNNNCCCSNSNSNGRNLHCCNMSCCCSCPTAEEGATSQSGCYCPGSITEVTSATTWDTQKATDNLPSQRTMCGSPSSCTSQADASCASAAVAVAPGSKRTACPCSSISSCNWQIKQPRSCTPRTHQEAIHPVQQALSMQVRKLLQHKWLSSHHHQQAVATCLLTYVRGSCIAAFSPLSTSCSPMLITVNCWFARLLLAAAGHDIGNVFCHLSSPV
jgi:hypothetical protein